MTPAQYEKLTDLLLPLLHEASHGAFVQGFELCLNMMVPEEDLN
jgi:hypothetical protein